jgi:hypothetical protein
MRLFTLVDYHHFIIALFLGCLAALILYLAFRYGTGQREGEGLERQTRAAMEEYPEGLRIGDNPVPPVLILLLIGFVVWFVCYAVFFGILGGPV